MNMPLDLIPNWDLIKVLSEKKGDQEFSQRNSEHARMVWSMVNRYMVSVARGNFEIKPPNLPKIATFCSR